jgi:hypothetical protein
VQLGMSALGQKRTHAAQQKGSLFDQLVGAAEQRRWYGKARRFGGLEIDDQLEFGRKRDRLPFLRKGSQSRLRPHSLSDLDLQDAVLKGVPWKLSDRSRS